MKIDWDNWEIEDEYNNYEDIIKEFLNPSDFIVLKKLKAFEFLPNFKPITPALYKYIGVV